MNLYLRLLKLLLWLPFAPRHDPFAESRLTFRAWPHDCDINLHLTNGRYLAFMDLGRIQLMAQTGMLTAMWRHGLRPALTAVEINFIRAIDPFQRFDLVSRVLTWDDKCFYLEQRFETAERVCSISLMRTPFLRRGVRIAPHAVIAAMGLDLRAPELSEVVRHWNDLTELKKAHAVRTAQ